MSFELLLWIAPLAAFVSVLALIPLARIAAFKIGLVDQPGGRKHHEGAIPLIGGVVIFPVFLIGALLTGVDITAYWTLFAALALIVTAGALDDRFHIGAWVKFFVQISAALLIVLAGNAQLYSLGDLFGLGPFDLGIMAFPFSMAAVVLLINAINLMDGLDGLAGGKSFVILGWLALACGLSGQWAPFLTLSVLLGALAGFLVYNIRHPLRDKACVFLGDSGSLGLGLVIAWFAIGLGHEPDPVVTPISVAWILALPIMDTCAQFYRRYKEGRHPFDADRGHFHHHFVHAGIPVGQSTALILLLGVILGGVGYGGVYFGVPQVILTVSWIGLILLHMALSRKPEIYINMLKKFTR